MNTLMVMAWALTVTLALELIFSLIWGLRRHQLLMVVLMNILTNPAANALYSFMTVYLGWQRLVPALFLEVAVIAVEGLCCRGFIKHPWLFVILANGFSFSTGLMLQVYF